MSEAQRQRQLDRYSQSTPAAVSRGASWHCAPPSSAGFRWSWRPWHQSCVPPGRRRYLDRGKTRWRSPYSSTMAGHLTEPTSALYVIAAVFVESRYRITGDVPEREPLPPGEIG